MAKHLFIVVSVQTPSDEGMIYHGRFVSRELPMGEDTPQVGDHVMPFQPESWEVRISKRTWDWSLTELSLHTAPLTLCAKDAERFIMNSGYVRD